MNRSLSKYILSLPELGMRVWLRLYSDSTPNGNSIVNYKDLAALYSVSIDVIKKVFDVKQAVWQGLIKVQTQTESLTIINFKTGGRPSSEQSSELTIPAKKAKKKPTEPTVKKEKGTKRVLKGSSKSQLPAVIKKEKPVKASLLPKVQRNKHDAALQQQQPIEQVQINEADTLATLPYEFSGKVKNWIIADYCEFYKGLQLSRAALTGISPEVFKPVNPFIQAWDIKAFKEIANYLNAQGCTNVGMVIRSFRRIYSHWEHLDEWCQNGITPSAIQKNLSKIIIQLQNLKKPSHDSNKGQKDLHSKLSAADTKDYSHLDKKK